MANAASNGMTERAPSVIQCRSGPKPCNVKPIPSPPLILCSVWRIESEGMPASTNPQAQPNDPSGDGKVLTDHAEIRPSDVWNPASHANALPLKSRPSA